MTIDYISDTHIDFWCKEVNGQSPKLQKQIDTLFNYILPKEGDVLIIAGDLGHYYSQDITFLKRLKTFYKHIFLVPGNHDMYLVSNGTKKKYGLNSWNRVLEMKAFCRENDGFHYLDGNVINIDGINFGGAGMSWDGSFAKTLWPDVSMGELLGHWENVMNDSRLIYENGRDHTRIPTAYGGSYSEPSFNPVEFFKSQKEKLDKIDAVDVMITHYAPRIPDNMRQSYREDLTSTFYYFDGSEYVEKLKPKYWVYGHTHDRVDEVENGCNFLCNPLGYPGENTYNVIKRFEIKDIE